MLPVRFWWSEANKFDMKMSFEDIENGPPIVLLHAFPLSNEMWEAQSEMLSNSGFRVILPNFPGFGENNSSKSIYSLEQMAGQIAELLEYLTIKTAVIGGLSMGGYILFNLFRMAPEIFSALVLCDTTPSADTVEKRNGRFELISKIENQGAKALVQNMLPNLISDFTKQNNPSLVQKLEEIFLRVNPDSAVNALRAMAERKDHADVLPRISVPTLLIFGEFDKVTNLENARKMNRDIRGSELLIIKNAGHYSNLEQPEQFDSALLNFCRQIEF
jgi:pimeloyl-ACP methyl ester carboxylesterase